MGDWCDIRHAKLKTRGTTVMAALTLLQTTASNFSQPTCKERRVQNSTARDLGGRFGCVRGWAVSVSVVRARVCGCVGVCVLWGQFC